MLNRTSRTAQHVTLFRAIETARRHDRVIDDPYAVTFLTGRYGLLARTARVPAARRGLERYLDRRFPGGPRASAVVRTRLIDGLVEDALAAGAGQVDRRALDGTGDFEGVWQDAVRRHGEPWTFGLDPAALPAYLDERGWTSPSTCPPATRPIGTWCRSAGTSRPPRSTGSPGPRSGKRMSGRGATVEDEVRVHSGASTNYRR